MLQFSLLLDTWLENLEHIACWSLKVSQLCKNSRCLFVNITFSAHKFIQQQFIATYLSCLLEVLPASCCLCHKLHLHYLFQDACIWHTPITTKADNKLYAHIQRQFHSHGVGNVQGRGCTIDNMTAQHTHHACVNEDACYRDNNEHRNEHCIWPFRFLLEDWTVQSPCTRSGWSCSLGILTRSKVK